MSVILCLSGKKKSGKGVLANHLLNNFHDLTPFRTARIYSFASEFKKVAIEVLGLPSRLVYGSNEDKETLTEYLWENLPHYLRIIESANFKLNNLHDKLIMDLISVKTYHEECHKVFVPTGPMTIRNLLQEIGTGMFRILDQDIWIKSLIRRVNNEKYDLAIVDDCRFPNELMGILNHDKNNKVIRLTRSISDDQHISETALDNETNFSFVLDNANMTEKETKDQFDNYLRSLYNV